MSEMLDWHRSNVDAVIVDLDGTMVDTLGDFVQALQRMVADLPLPYRDFVVEQALVEQMAAAASGLKEQAKELVGVVTVFRLAT